MGNFNVYKSSAGSGKTFLLVKQYLLLCLVKKSPYHFSKILAITFTNKAANEMKTRIIENLRILSSAKEGNGLMQNLLKEESGLSDLEIQNRSEFILKSILHNYADFNVSTIDRFTHRIVRTFAKDLALPYNFKVELNQKELIQEVVLQIIDKTGKNSTVTAALLEQVSYLIDNDKSWNPEKDLIELSYTILQEEGVDYMNKLKDLKPEEISRIRSKFYQKSASFKNRLDSISKAFFNLTEGNNIDPSDFYQGKNGISSFFKNIVAYQNELSNLANLPNSYAVKTISEEKYTSAKTTRKEAIESIVPQIRDLYFKAMQILENERAEFIAREMLSKKLNLLTLLKEVDEGYNKLKSENNLVPISDFNQKISEVVLNEPLPFIYERLGEKYDHILVDEFQDTSVLQFMNLLPIIEESLARGNFNLIVGDAKQAIYRFRGGDIEQFAAMPDHVPKRFSDNPLVLDRLQHIKMHYQEHSLSTNYRSAENIVHFNNAFFDHLKSYLLEDKRIYFEGHQQAISKTGTGGYVEINFINKGDTEEYVPQLLSHIEDCAQAGYQYKDMVLMCRRSKDLVFFAEALSKEGIPIVSAESLLLNNSPKVRFIIHFMQWVEQSDRAIAILGLLRFFAKDQSFNETNQLLQQYLINDSNISSFLQDKGMQTCWSQWKTLSIYELVETSIREFGLNKSYDPYLQFLLEYVHDFQSEETGSLSAFLLWWEEQKEKLSIESADSENAIQLMTVHKSKGLEFEIVFYPLFNAESSPPNTQDIWVNPEHIEPSLPAARVNHSSVLDKTSFQEDYLDEVGKQHLDFANTEYVAFTRASERLYLMANTLPKSPSDNNTLKLNMILHDFEHARLEKDDLIYRFGEKRNRVIQKKTSISREGISRLLPSSSWRENIQLSLQSSKWTGEEKLNARQYGSVFHELMSKLDVNIDIDKQIQLFKRNGEVQKDEISKLKADVNAILNDPDCRQFFLPNDQVKKEAALLNQNHKVLRPDRVVYKEEEVLILDYKTGEEDKKHHSQLKEYKEALQNIEQKNVKAYLYYLDQKKLVQVINE